MYSNKPTRKVLIHSSEKCLLMWGRLSQRPFCLCLVFVAQLVCLSHLIASCPESAHTLCRPYLLCAQVIAVIFLIQPKLNEKWVGGGIDPWAHLSEPHLSLRRHSGRSAWKCHCSSLDWPQAHTAHIKLITQFDRREEKKIKNRSRMPI